MSSPSHFKSFSSGRGEAVAGRRSRSFPAVAPANPPAEMPRESDTMPTSDSPVAGGLGRHSPVMRELRGIHQRATACAAFSASAGSTSVRPRALAPPQSPPAVRFMGGKPYYANCFYEPEVGSFMIHSCLVAVCPVSARQGALLVSARLNVTFHADHMPHSDGAGRCAKRPDQSLQPSESARAPTGHSACTLGNAEGHRPVIHVSMSILTRHASKLPTWKGTEPSAQ